MSYVCDDCGAPFESLLGERSCFSCIVEAGINPFERNPRMKMTQEGLIQRAKKSVDMLIANTTVGLDQTLVALRNLQSYTELHIQSCIQKVGSAQANQAPVEEEEQEEAPTEVQAVPPRATKRGRRARQEEAPVAVEAADEE